MRMTDRLTRLERDVRRQPDPDKLSFITAIAADSPEAERRKVGLYREGPAGSTTGLLIFDPAKGEPVVPDERLAPWGLMVVLGPDKVEPPRDDVVPLTDRTRE